MKIELTEEEIKYIIRTYATHDFLMKQSIIQTIRTQAVEEKSNAQKDKKENE